MRTVYIKVMHSVIPSSALLNRSLFSGVMNKCRLKVIEPSEWESARGLYGGGKAGGV
jgi:hypothetical protein